MANQLPPLGTSGNNQGGAIATPIQAPNILQRIGQGFSYMFGGKTPEPWMSPQNPVLPVAQEPAAQTKGRQFDYPVGYNVNYTPRQYEGGMGIYQQLRTLADTYDLVRLCIETRKDQMVAQQWAIQNKDPMKIHNADSRIQQLQEFFEYPDKEHDWATWLRMIMEDMLVIDAATIYPRLTLGGELYALEPMDGSTIKRVIDGYGRTPIPPLPAYQQILKGVPAVDYTSEELIFKPRNMRTWRLYGMSPVEQIVVTINIALRRQAYQLQYFTEGNVPDSIMTTPENWTPDQIAEFQAWWDSIMVLESKRSAKFVPFGVDHIDTKANAMGTTDDVMNEWLSRIVCYCFSLNPTQLVKSNNRATSDTSMQEAQDTGFKPIKDWVASVMTLIINRYFGYTDLKFVFQSQEEVEPLARAQIHQAYYNMGVITEDEIRADIGKEPLSPEQQAKIDERKKAALGALAGNTGDGDDGENPDDKPKDKKQPDEDSEDESEKIAKRIVIENHVHQGDTLVEIGPTVNKFEKNSDGNFMRIDPDAKS